MRDSIVTPGRLTIQMPVVKHVPTKKDRLEALEMISKEGRQLVHNILVRKGMTYLTDKSGTRLKPIAQVIFNSNMQRLASNEPPESIVRDLSSQLLLVTGKEKKEYAL